MKSLKRYKKGLHSYHISFSFYSVVLEGSNTKLKINIFGVLDSDEMVEKMNSLKDDLNIDKIYVNGDELDRER